MATISETLEIAVKHHQAGELQHAGRIYEEILRTDSDHAVALHLFGVVAHQVGQHQLAVERIGRAISLRPGAVAFHSNLGAAYVALGKLSEGASSFQRALQIQPDLAAAHNNLGSVLRTQGRLDEAEACFRRALEIEPDYVDAHSNLGGALGDQRRLEEAEASLRRALELQPDSAQAHNGLGVIIQHQPKPDEAVACFRRAVELRPDYASAIANLARLYERLNRVEDAASTVAECLRIAPDHPAANLVAGQCEEREGRQQEAIDRLERVRSCGELDAAISIAFSFQLGRLYDGVGDTARAFAEFTRANRLVSQRLRSGGVEKEQYLRDIEILGETFSKTWVDSWLPAPPLCKNETPVFLIGFPRSGTTLLDVILDGHPRIRTLEEKPAVLAVETEIKALPGGYPQAMADLTPAQIEQLRATYFRTVDGFIDRRPGQILVDKYPLNSLRTGIILRVFPAARFIVAVRHPCDCCLSCFMQNFEMNWAMANFLTLEDTALLYAKAMDLWRQCVRVLPHPYHLVRYEDLVDDFETEVRRLLEFLELDWDDGVRDYAEQARRRGRVNTVSYDQVVRPIYKQARYRWQRYAEYLEPIIGVLKPHIDYFGYESSIPRSDGRSS
jgi:tetratricopeptide (TPR) repeat protein